MTSPSVPLEHSASWHMMAPVRGFFRWWVDELARTVEPLAARRRSRAPFVLVEDGEGGYRCLRAGRKGLNDLGLVGSAPGAKPDLMRKLKGQHVELRLDRERVLDQEIGLPAAGQQYLEAILRHQIERLTPWAADHVAFDYEVRPASAGDGQMPVRLVATSKETVADAIERLEAAGIRVEAVGTAADPLEVPSPIDLRDASRSERQSSLRRTVASTLMAAAVVLLLIGTYQSWRAWRAESQSEEIQQAIDARRAVIAEAVARTTASDEYRALTARKESAVPMVLLLDELSRRIPANTYLTELTIEGPTVRINGISTEAPALIGLLETSDTLEGARFGAPTTRAADSGADSFQIVVQVAQPEAER